MPIADRAASAILSSLAEGVWTQLSSNPQPVEHGFDTLDVVWICDFRATAMTALAILEEHFPQGQRYGSRDFWLRAATPERQAGNVWIVRAHYEGRISADKPMGVKMRGTNEVFGIDSIAEIPGFPLYPDIPANVREASPGVELSYVLVDDTPATHLIGLAGTPAVSPAVRSGFWGGLAAKAMNFPSGFVLTDMDVDRIAGSSPTADFVSETWQYFHQWLPA